MPCETGPRTDGQLQVLDLERVALAMLDQLASKGGDVLDKVLRDVLQHLGVLRSTDAAGSCPAAHSPARLRARRPSLPPHAFSLHLSARLSLARACAPCRPDVAREVPFKTRDVGEDYAFALAAALAFSRCSSTSF